ncbi:phage protein [Streptococcus pneumoniae]|nr:phage protein [Streptococcus pneumoniae]
MNKQELIKRIEDLPYTEGPIADTIEINRNWILKSIEQLAESEIGHADEAPRYVKNILARLRELPLHDREVWLKAIMSEFEQDFSHAKWREGYEQGKIEGMVEREKVIVPQCVADWIRKCKMFKHFAVSLSFALQPIVWEENNLSDKCIDWLMDANNQELFARAWLDGYEVEEEKRYLVTLKNRQPLVKSQSGSTLYFSQDITARNYKGTQKELEDANFGWVFDCPGIEIEEVE